MGAMYFSQTLLVFWLFKNGFKFSDVIIYYLISYVAALVGIFLMSRVKMRVKPYVLFGVLLSALSVAVLINISHTYGMYQIFFSGIITGLNIIFFWIPYNIMHFKFNKESKIGLNSGMYFLITPIIGITLQPLAGFVAEKFGFETMFLIGMLLYLVPIFLTRYLPDFEWNLDIRKEITDLKFNWTTFFQGFVSRINYSLVPIFTLFFYYDTQSFW